MPRHVREMPGPAESLMGVFGDIADTSCRLDWSIWGPFEAQVRGVRSSLDTVPAHEARRRPVGLHRLDQPAAGMLGSECDALGLSGLERQRVPPTRLPAVIEPVQKPEMM